MATIHELFNRRKILNLAILDKAIFRIGKDFAHVGILNRHIQYLW